MKRIKHNSSFWVIATSFCGRVLESCIAALRAGGIKWLEAGDRKALRVTHGSQRLLMPGETSMWASSHRRAPFDNDTVEGMVKLVSKLLSERRVILLVGVVDCNNGWTDESCWS